MPLEDNEAWIHPIKAIMVSVINWVYHDLRECTIRAMSPQTRMNFESIKLVLTSRSTPRGTLD